MDTNFSHIFLPKHSIASEEEITQMLLKFKITKENLPLILSEDPVAKQLGAKIGDVIRIQRGEKDIYYRIVID
ncbi:DNA-directed RNA polymerase subunit H [Candidatus Micrarchaeota archaeon]|nr:DNA-directed RNA polymerase subunit H [Candidatus Micrarchaeota archaeon]